MNILSKNESMLIPLIVFLTLCGIAIQFFYGFSWTDTSGHSFASDDAFITYRYAENFFLGNGIYFNSSEKVEGYSNFLYLLMMTPGMAISQKYIYIYSTIINTLLLFTVMIYFYNILTIEVGKRYALLGTSLVGINPAIWANVTTGLETILILFIFVFMWYLIKKTRTSINILLIFIISSISMLSRVDGFIFPLIISLYMLLNKERKTGFMLGLYTFIFMGVYAVLRYYYYEDVIANTYYAKVSGDIFQRINAGFQYLYNQTKYNGIAFYFLFTIIFFAKNIFSNLKLLISFELIFILVWIAYMIYIGGDIYFERFLLPILLFGIFYFVRFLSNQKQTAVNFLLPVVIIISFSLLYKDDRFAYQNKTYDMWVNLGKFLNQSPNNYVLAIDAAGKVPYFSKLKTIDMLGLNNKDIGKMKVDGKKFVAGHTKYNVDYILSKKPDIIAAWIYQNEDMTWGISKVKYADNYILKYLINSSRNNLEINIYDVEKFPKFYKSTLIHHGFNYGVLIKKSSLNKMPNMITKIPVSLLPKAIQFSRSIDFKSSFLSFDSWSIAEQNHRWSLGNNSKLLFRLDNKLPTNGNLSLTIGTLGKQEIKLVINDHYIESQTVNGEDINLTFKFDPNILHTESINTLEFEFPNAHKPDNGDQRVLAIALKSFKIE